MQGTDIQSRDRVGLRRRDPERPEEEEKPGERNGAPRRAAPLAWRLARLAVFGAVSALAVAVIFLLFPELRAGLGSLIASLGGLDAAAIKEWVLSFGALSPVVYFLIVVAQVIASPIPAGPVTLAGALTFGVLPGLALSMAGSVVGSVLVFAAVRRWGEPLVIRLIGKETFHKYVGRLDEKGWWLFVILLFPFMPDDAVCALAGLSAVSLRRFLLLMVVGRLPGATMTALLASDAVTGSAAAWITVGMLVVVLSVLGFVYRERMESWFLRRTGDEPQDGSGRWDG